MKKGFLFTAILITPPILFAHGLMKSYQLALENDPTFRAAISQTLATKENVPISLSALLPTISASANPSITRAGFSGTNYLSSSGGTTSLSPRNNTQRAYTLSLTLTQTIFNFAQFANLASALATAKSAEA